MHRTVALEIVSSHVSSLFQKNQNGSEQMIMNEKDKEEKKSVFNFYQKWMFVHFN